MYNCTKLYINGRLKAIVHTESDAELLIRVLIMAHPLLFNESDFKIEKAYVENTGF
jgi:hypothetical protein